MTQPLLPRAFVQDAAAEICMQASCLQQAAKAWLDLTFAGQAGDTDGVLGSIDGTIALLTRAREQIVFVRDREGKKVTAAVAADAGARRAAGQAVSA